MLRVDQYSCAKTKPLPFEDVHWTEGFWKLKEDLCEKNTIDSVYDALNDETNSAVFKNFYILAGLEKGEYSGSTYWGDGDCYKWLEAATYIWYKNKDPKLKEKIDREIEVIGKAQCEDGYIHTYIQMTGQARFKTRQYHEDYNFGHLFTAAAVHYNLTGEDFFLKIAKKAADFLYEEYTKPVIAYPHYGWNPSQIMGLVDLYRVTEEKKYLELAEIFTELKGKYDVSFEFCKEGGSADGGGDQNQDRTPLKKETAPVGHAVTAVYLYAGAADICAEKDDPELLAALERISEHLYQNRVYITGGVGPQHFGFSEHNDPVHEAFDRDYHLPLSTAYNETCANVGSAMWHWRMFLLTGKAKYMDRVEIIMYNSGISGMSADGRKFRYTNPLKWYGAQQELLSNDTEERWFTHSCYCCPPQMARTMASMNRYACSQGENSLWFNLYGGCEIDTVINGKKIHINEETCYPWEGVLTFTIQENIENFSLFFRIPGYSEDTSLTYNGKVIPCQKGTYCSITGSFHVGDTIVLSLDMNVKKIKSNPKVESTKNQVALMRGPVVYCLEGADLAGRSVDRVFISPKSSFIPEYMEDLLYGLTVLKGKGIYLENAEDALYSEWGNEKFVDLDLMLIPYYAWNNRGCHEMSVWLPVYKQFD